MAGVFYNFIYDGTIEGLFCVFLRCISTRVIPKDIRSFNSSDGIYDTDTYTYINTNYSLAKRFYDYLGNFADVNVQQMVRDCFLTSLPRREIEMYMLIRQALWRGSSIGDDFSDEGLRRIQMAIRDLYRESQGMLPELQFHDAGNVDFSVINPRNIVLPIIMDNLLNDVRLDDFMVYDTRHRLVLLRNYNKDYIVDISKVCMNMQESTACTGTNLWNYLVVDGHIRKLRPIHIDGRLSCDYLMIWDTAG